MALSIGLYFRRLRAIPLTGVPAALGTVMAFAVAELAFGYLNSSTAFLGSIIIGNGINYAIVLMSRYEEHRARGSEPNEALRLALAGTWRGTLVASISASAAYASLMVTSFRGLLPVRRDGRGRRAVLLVRDLHRAARDARAARSPPRRRRGGRRRPRTPLELGPLAGFLRRHAGAVTAAFTVLSIVAASWACATSSRTRSNTTSAS